MLTKMVDGVEVQLTPEEESAVRAEWAANEALPLPAPQPTLADLIAILKADPDAAARLDEHMRAKNV